MSNIFKNGIDRQLWVQTAPTGNAHAAGMGMASDLRNDKSRNPFAFQLVSSAILNRYNFSTKSWMAAQTALGLAGTFGAGAGAVFAPSHALTGTIGTGSTTTSIVTSTTITSVAPNMFANRGGSGDYGYRVRITSVGSGLTQERWIVGNSSGTTPTLLLDTALTFSPVSGDTYEILSGRVFMLGAGTMASGSWKSFEVGANTLATKGYTNLPATISTDFSAVCLDELYVPYDMLPGEGLIAGSGTYDTSGISKRCLVSTAIASGTITGQASSGDAVVRANEYRNFQIRIVEDTTNKTAVGQRRIIASHTAGVSPVYTLGAAWTVTPSVGAKYVIENPNLILLWSSAGTTTYTYNYGPATVTNGTNSIAADAWSTAYFAARGVAMAAGCTSFPSFGIEPDEARYARHSNIYSFRGGGTSLDLFDIAGATTGSWTSAITYDGGGASFGTGSCGKYAPGDNEGRFGYLNVYVASQINQIWRFDCKNRVLSSYTPTTWIQSGTAAAGDRLATFMAIDGTDKYTVLMLVAHLAANAMELVIKV